MKAWSWRKRGNENGPLPSGAGQGPERLVGTWRERDGPGPSAWLFSSSSRARFPWACMALAAPATAPRAAPPAISLRTSRVVGVSELSEVGALETSSLVSGMAAASWATLRAAPVTAPTTAPATMVSSTSPVFSTRLCPVLFAFRVDVFLRASLDLRAFVPPTWTWSLRSRKKMLTFSTAPTWRRRPSRRSRTSRNQASPTSRSEMTCVSKSCGRWRGSGNARRRGLPAGWLFF